MTDAVIVIGTMDFREELSAKEYAIRLSERHAVLYVERQVGPEHLLFDRELWPGRVTGAALRRISGRLWVYTPPPVFIAHNMSTTLNGWEQAILVERLRAVLQQLGWTAAGMLIYQHNSAALIDGLRSRRSAYVIIDEFVATARGRRRAVISALENDLLRRTDAVLAAASTVFDRVRALRPDVIRFPSAVDLELFDPARYADILPQPRSVATVATFDERIDLGLMAGVLRALPDYSFHFFGRDGGGLGQLRGLANVLVHGPVPHADLPRLLAPHPVCLLPYARTAATAGVSSLKLLEYLALGKAVVATPVADTQAWTAEIRVGATVAEWVAHIRAASDARIAVPARRAALAKHSYTARLATLRRVLEITGG